MMDVDAMEQRVKMASCTDAKKIQNWLNSFMLKRMEEDKVKVVPKANDHHCMPLESCLMLNIFLSQHHIFTTASHLLV